jgi:sodium/bile acid cotransporter 7
LYLSIQLLIALIFMMLLTKGLCVHVCSWMFPDFLQDLKKALFTIRIHAFIQIFTLAFIPSAVFCLVQLLSYTSLDIWLRTGSVKYDHLYSFEFLRCIVLHTRLLVISCMPPPVSSAVIMTKAVGGNEVCIFFCS